MLRPSVNQITSAYTGRMPALQDQVEKDKQANNGIPSDLRKLMALQDLLSDGQHMGIDQALKAPQNPATVSQSLQDRARQILGTKMAQAQQGNEIAKKQQEQMVNQGRPGPVPAGVSQPERQPEGIDQLVSNVGESYANGGIVAFKTGDEVEDSAVVKAMKEFAQKFSGPTDEDRKVREAQRYFKQQASGINAFTQSASDYDKAQAVNDFVQANPTIVNSPVFRADPAGYVARSIENKKTAKPATMTSDESLSSDMRLINKAEAAGASRANEAPAVSAPVSEPAKKSVNVSATPPTATPSIAKPTSKPSIANLPTLPPELPTPEPGSPRAIMGEAMKLDPDAEMKRFLANRERMLGAPDTSQYQALINELRGQKEQLLKKPETGLDSVMDYFRDIAAGPTVGRSGKAGAIALEKQRLRDLENQKQANSLSERMIEAAQKQQDVEYGYKKEGFTLSEAERARVWQERFNSAKAAGALDHEARKLAQDAVLDREKIAAQIKAAQIGAAAHKSQLVDMAERLVKEDKTGKLTMQSAMETAAKIVGTSSLAGTDAKNVANYAKELDKLENSLIGLTRSIPGPKGKLAQQQYDAKVAELKQLHGITDGAGLNSLSAASSGTPTTQERKEADAIIRGGK